MPTACLSAPNRIEICLSFGAADRRYPWQREQQFSVAPDTAAVQRLKRAKPLIKQALPGQAVVLCASVSQRNIERGTAHTTIILSFQRIRARALGAGKGRH